MAAILSPEGPKTCLLPFLLFPDQHGRRVTKVNGLQCFSALTFGTNKMRRVTVAVI